jgi:selenide, water dikinase
VRLVLDPSSFPALPGALTVARRGLRTGGDLRNREFVAGAAELDGLPEELDILGFDPQTAGGLLIALPAAKGAVLEAAFSQAALSLARIGEAVEGAGVALA